MNLTVDPWIPAIHSDGRRALFSLQDLFAQAPQLRDLAAKPHERIALMRLLLCITQAALDGPADQDDWEQCEPLIQPRVRDYLNKWQGSFELFGEGPRFLQIKPGTVTAATPVMEDEGITRLNLCLASGESNSTLFDNSASDNREFSAGQSAISLLTYQCYSPLLGRGYKGKSPCADCSMLHTFVLGANLCDTIWLNLLPRDTVDDNYAPHGMGRPIWETSLIKDDARKKLAQSFLGRLLPLTRAIWLESAAVMTLGNGLVYEGFLDSGYREASATIVNSKDKLFLLKARTDRAFWRQLSSICVKNRQADGVSGPLALRNPIQGSDVTIWTGALISDQAKIEDSVESVYIVPAKMFDDFGRCAYEAGVRHADERETALVQAIKLYASTLKVVSPSTDRARQHYWTRIEQSLSALFDVARNLISDLPPSPWGKAVQQAALAAYEQSCPRQTPRQIQAYALGLRCLFKSPAPNLKPQTPNPKNHE